MKNLSLKSKIAIVVIMLIVSNVVTVYMGLSKLGALNRSMDNINTSLYKRISMLNKINAVQLNLSINIRDIIIMTKEEDVKKYIETMSGNKEKLLTNLQGFIDIASEQGKIDAGKYKEQFLAWFAAAEEVQKLSLAKQNAEAALLSSSKLAPLRRSMGQVLDGIVTLNEGRMNEAAENAAQEYIMARNSIVLISFGFILASCVFAFIIIQNFSKAINGIVSTLSDSSSQVGEAAGQIATSSNSLASSVTEQASTLEETVATMEELNSMIRNNTDNSKQSATLAATSSEMALKGEYEIKKLIEAMQSIAADSKKISDITLVIDDIAFQTNLLALNAAVEAARAGEQGKSFAVVAEAVRNLAQRSAEAAKDIASLIKASVEKISDGSTQASQSGVVLGEIVSCIKKVSALNNEVALASEEQTKGSVQIGAAMNQIDQVTQQNAAASEEAAAAAEELSAQATNLKAAVSDLVGVVAGAAARDQHAA